MKVEIKVEYHKDTKTISKMTPYVNGVIHSSVNCWYINGKRMYRVKYVNGITQGNQFVWMSGSYPSHVIPFVNGKRNGRLKHYKNGILVYENDYKNDIADGLAIHRFYLYEIRRGNLFLLETRKLGIRNGVEIGIR